MATIHMPCPACQHQVSATTIPAVNAAYFDHRAAAHTQVPPLTRPLVSAEALRKLVSLVQARG